MICATPDRWAQPGYKNNTPRPTEVHQSEFVYPSHTHPPTRSGTINEDDVNIKVKWQKFTYAWLFSDFTIRHLRWIIYRLRLQQLFSPKWDTTAYHTGKEPSPRHRLLEAMAERIQLLLHPCCETRGFCVYWHHTQHIRMGVVGSHSNGQQLDCYHTVDRSEFPHFVVPPWCSPSGVSLSPTSLRGDFFE